MRISKIIVENYRSIKRVEVEPAGFSVFVGQNNHGKTNFFEAIEWFYNAKKSSDDEHLGRSSKNVISVHVFFEDVITSDIDKLSKEINRTKIRKMLGGATSFSVLKTSVDHKRKYFVGAEEKANPTGFDTTMNEFLPKLEYVNTKIRLDDVSKYKDKNPIGVMLSGVLTAIIEGSEEYKAFRDQFSKLFDDDNSGVRVELDKLGKEVEIYLQKQFPDGTTVKFKVNPPQITELLKSFETTVDDGIVTKAEDKGDGMQRAIMLSIIQAFADYRKQKSGGGTFLFMIDEAELHLHPSAQRALKNALLEIADKDQVLVNTHSSVLVVEDDEKQKIFRVEKEAGVTGIDLAQPSDKIDIVFDLLGGSPSDLLLPRNFLIVEGQSEFEFIRAIIHRFYQDKFSGIKILFARGDIDEQESALLAIHKLFSPLAGADNPIYKDRAVILIDKPNADQQSKYNLFKTGYPYLFDKKQVFELTEQSLEEYYPAPFKKTAEEAKQLAVDKQKVQYAKTIASKILQTDFEQKMTVIFDAIKACNDNSFNPK